MAISSDMKPIKITDSETGKQYILEFNRATVKATEQSGFNPELVDSQTVSQVSKLFYGAFKKNHPQISYDKVEKIIDELDGIPKKMIFRLLELYSYAADTLIRDEDEDENEGEEAKNSKLTVEM